VTPSTVRVNLDTKIKEEKEKVKQNLSNKT
jgi:hypothetical protein